MNMSNHLSQTLPCYQSHTLSYGSMEEAFTSKLILFLCFDIEFDSLPQIILYLRPFRSLKSLIPLPCATSFSLPLKQYSKPPSSAITYRIANQYNWSKPNDIRALNLMNAAALRVMTDVPTLILAYGCSDEYSFIFSRSTTLFERRQQKLLSTVCSVFTAAYLYLWPTYFPDTPLVYPLPSFDARAVLYPNEKCLRDYFAWRQVDCHINNLYNTTFWMLVLKGGRTRTQAELELKGTLAADKNEVLYKLGVNYNAESEMWKKGNLICWDRVQKEDMETEETNPVIGTEESKIQSQHDEPMLIEPTPSDDPPASTTSTKDPDDANTINADQKKKKTWKEKKELKNALKGLSAPGLEQQKLRLELKLLHLDVIKDAFWTERPWILG
jgi:tRNA(His) guanylyltransferase